jgi:ABC-2 type transport system ATP-binding protein
VSAPPIEARSLVKRYGEITAVDDVDLTVEAGDVYGYLGPNGAGKTTSLRMLLGLIRPTSGSARLFGRDPLLEGARALEGVAGFVEAPRFYTYLPGRANLELLARLDGGDARARIDEALDVVDLTARGKDKVGGYSHGMRQRLGIAAALIRRPRLLLLDEPATGLDPAGMRDMRALIQRLAADGITVLLSSHQLAEVEELCNRVAIVRTGRIIYEGTIASLKASGGERHRVTTTDDARALELLRVRPGVERSELREDGVSFVAPSELVPELSLALASAGIGIRELVADTATLEQLFFRLTEGAIEEPAAPVAGRPLAEVVA